MSDKTYVVSSGPRWKARVRANSERQAAAKAIERDCPQDLGRIIEIIGPSKVPMYLDVRVALADAGFVLEE